MERSLLTQAMFRYVRVQPTLYASVLVCLCFPMADKIDGGHGISYLHKKKMEYDARGDCF